MYFDGEQYFENEQAEDPYNHDSSDFDGEHYFKNEQVEDTYNYDSSDEAREAAARLDQMLHDLKIAERDVDVQSIQSEGAVKTDNTIHLSLSEEDEEDDTAIAAKAKDTRHLSVPHEKEGRKESGTQLPLLEKEREVEGAEEEGRGESGTQLPLLEKEREEGAEEEGMEGEGDKLPLAENQGCEDDTS